MLDEPFSGLDPIGVDLMSDVLREVAARGVPVVFSSHQLELVERLCDAVAIIAEGRLVATGTVAELRAQRGAADAWRVDVDADPAQWLGAVPAAEVLDRGDAGVLLRVGEHDDPQAVLDAARAAGRVRRFAREEPSLAELFREVAR